MLASRGFVYHSAKTAGEDKGHYHANCHCTIVPGFAGQTEVEGYDTDELKEQYEYLKMEQGRRSKTNKYSIDDSVHQQSFHEAFEKMPINKKVRESAYIQSKRILERADGKLEEYMVAIDAKTGELVVDNLDRPSNGASTGFTKKDFLITEQCENGVITIHNHPDGGRPSYADIETASKHDHVKGSIVVGHNGRVWFMNPDSNTLIILRSYYGRLAEYGDRDPDIKAVDKLLKQNEQKRIFTFIRTK